MDSTEQQDVPARGRSAGWPALVSVCTGLMVGPVFFGSVALIRADADKTTKELSLAMGGIGAICLSIAAIVFGVIALVRCRHQHDALAKAGGIIGIGAVMLFWSFCALLFALSAMYF